MIPEHTHTHTHYQDISWKPLTFAWDSCITQHVCASDYKHYRMEEQVVLLLDTIEHHMENGNCVPISMWGEGPPILFVLYLPKRLTNQAIYFSNKQTSLSWFRLLMRLLSLALVLKIFLNSRKMASDCHYSFYHILGHKCLAQTVGSKATCSFMKYYKDPVFIWKDKQN